MQSIADSKEKSVSDNELMDIVFQEQNKLSEKLCCTLHVLWFGNL